MKHFTDSFLNEYDILKNARIGIEFEFYSKLSYGNTLEILSRKLDKKVWGFKEYHSDFEVNENNWKIEPDFSAGINCVELVTHPMEYSEARIMLVKVYRTIQEIGYTTERTGLHLNISFKDEYLDIGKINPVKVVLGVSEEYIYSLFPERENNIYCKSVKRAIPYKDFDFSEASANILSSSLSLQSGISKYYGINFTCLNEGRLEYRYIGGTDYEWKLNETLEMFDYFVQLSYDGVKEKITPDEIKLLRRYLETNIAEYKSLSNVESFITKFPSVSIEVDRVPQIELVKSYYPTIYDSLYELVTQTKDLENCKLNFDTETRKLELVGAHFKGVGVLSNMLFIDCEIDGGDYISCDFYDSALENVTINQSNFNAGTIKEGKILECKVMQGSVLTECYFSEGMLDGEMESGIFRSGQLGKNAVISELVKMMNTDQNFFSLSTTNLDDGEKGKNKKIDKK